MDNIFILYLIKASIALTLFYALYMLLLKKDTFFKLRRGYFLFMMVFSLSFPFFSIEIPIQEEYEAQLPTYWLSQIEIDEIVVSSTVQDTSIDFWTILFTVTGVISIVLAIKFILQILSIVKLRMDNDAEKISYMNIVKLKNEKVSPFSFFNWIFINSGIDNIEELREVIAHEQVHVKQFHSVDVIIAEIMCICFWWNPVVWLLRNEMKINLEYLADQGVVKAGFDAREYQYILLQVINRNTGIPIINNFNVSQLKKRITMMNKKRTSIGKATKYLLAIPLGAVLLLGNAVQASPDLISLVADELQMLETKTEKPSVNENEEIIANHFPAKELKNTVTSEVKEDKKPVFPGGESAMHRFVSENLKYPIPAQEKGIDGLVMAKFTIKSTGEIGNIELTNKADELLNEEVKRVINLMPKWTPAQKNGKNVDADFTIPFDFVIRGKERSSEARKLLAEESANAVTIVVRAALSSLNRQKYDDEPLLKAQQMPSFQGGEEAMNKFVADNLKYPVDAQEKGIQGRVVVQFVVTKTGEITDATVVRGIDPKCDAEALRVVKAMPKWIPGTDMRREVDVYFTLPIVFKLKGESNDLSVLLLDGKEISEAELKSKTEMFDKENMIRIDKVLTAAQAESKYGDKYKGKKVVEISFKEVPKKEVGVKMIKEVKRNGGGKEVYYEAEQMPSYPGGEEAMNKFIANNLKYPVDAQEKGIQGRVTARFLVSKSGDISDIEIVRGVNPECDAEVIRVIKAMPKWNPGKQKGKEVDVYFTLPIVFKLKKEEKTENKEQNKALEK